MQLIRGLHNLRTEHRGCVATIGNFDGVHRGHLAVFAELLAEGRVLGVPATVIIFEPQPLEFFAPARAPARLTRFREKVLAIRDAGIQRLLLLEFGQKLAAMDAEAFVRHILAAGLGVRHLYVGDDFRFGKGREGDVGLLRRIGVEAGFSVDHLPTVALDGARISSTRVRNALEAGDLTTAATCLGRSYRIGGRVSHGDKRGRTLGFPTANLNLHRLISPLSGVFAVRVFGLEGGCLPGVANIGVRPTVAGDGRYLLEVHLFDFSREIYGRHLEVEFVQRIREVRRFDSFEQLRRQIDHDAYEARHILGLA
ncbi:MAG: bifunctional riboflavin kinase/FAD synthetase [Gammaproteobacteria bacterium]|nr:bifunctional riboflavin kinase/FAD synthetase [Gammaproteobacteria bacterium]MBU1656303.1 bifunctional riboflavin kinase/FAD synthetase [Gammaproteobacteria bacterium]MBU1959868.1 bifunctional riboflavin kinase/FAD synthetase [Gammaproteobacteria bacterium]